MVTFRVEKEQVELDYPDFLQKWSSIMVDQLGKTINESKLEFYYSYGFFIPKVQDMEVQSLQIYESTQEMMWPERLTYELSKVRIDLTFKMGNFVVTDRMPKNYVPESVVSIVKELTKLKMLFESEFTGNQQIFDSIPELDKSYFDMESVREAFRTLSPETYRDEGFDIDSILDKISESGLDSLTPSERQFLNQKSKEI